MLSPYLCFSSLPVRSSVFCLTPPCFAVFLPVPVSMQFLSISTCSLFSHLCFSSLLISVCLRGGVCFSVSISPVSGLLLCLCLTDSPDLSQCISLSLVSFSVSVSHYLLAPKDRIFQSLIQAELGSGPRECLLYLQFLLTDLGEGNGEWGHGAACLSSSRSSWLWT